jgi:hypothetical protein
MIAPSWVKEWKGSWINITLTTNRDCELITSFPIYIYIMSYVKCFMLLPVMYCYSLCAYLALEFHWPKYFDEIFLFCFCFFSNSDVQMLFASRLMIVLLRWHVSCITVIIVWKNILNPCVRLANTLRTYLALILRVGVCLNLPPLSRWYVTLKKIF